MFRDRAFRQSSRKYNNLFSFTAMGVSGEHGFVHQASPSCVKIHGRTYHRILPANHQGPVHWYVHDPQLARANEAHRLLLNVSYVTAIAQMLNQINPYAHHLRVLGQIPTANASLHICWRDESSEIAAIIHRGVGPEAGSRTVVFWKTSDQQPTFIQPQCTPRSKCGRRPHLLVLYYEY